MKKLTYTITEKLFGDDANKSLALTETNEIILNVFYHDEKQKGGKSLILHESYLNTLVNCNSIKEREEHKKKFIFPAHWLQQTLEQLYHEGKMEEKHLVNSILEEMSNDNRVIRWVKEAMGASGIMDFNYNEEEGMVEYHDGIIAGEDNYIGMIAKIDIDEFSITKDKYRYDGESELGTHTGYYDIGIEDDEWEDSNYWDIWNDEYHMKSSEIQINLCIL